MRTASDEHLAAMRLELDRLVSASIRVSNEETIERKQVDAEVDAEMSQMPFRLISSTKAPALVSLVPDGPPRVNIPRVVPAEDTSEEAETRRQRALAVAVDMDFIKKEASCFRTRPTKPHHPYRRYDRTDKKLIHAVFTNLPVSSSPMLLLESTKPHRHAQPPVHPDHFAWHPYSKETLMNPGEGLKMWGDGGEEKAAVGVWFDQTR